MSLCWEKENSVTDLIMLQGYVCNKHHLQEDAAANKLVKCDIKPLPLHERLTSPPRLIEEGYIFYQTAKHRTTNTM